MLKRLGPENILSFKPVSVVKILNLIMIDF